MLILNMKFWKKSYDLIIKDVSNSDTYTVPIDVIRSHFIFNYCGTCHSCQGSSIDENITIFDYQHFFCTRKWIWTAITRATELNNVYFYDYTETKMVESMTKSYFEKKVLGYKTQDKLANRKVSKDYVNVKWFMDAVNQCCSNCSCSFDISFTDGNIRSNITADRIRNDEDHNIENIQPMCSYCNCCKSNK